MNGALGKDALEAFFTQLIEGKRRLLLNRAFARAFRAVERRKSFNDIGLHERMLADAVRIGAYVAAIQRYVSAQDCVADIGTGTGILAFLAARQSQRKIYAIDQSRTMLDYARSVAAANRIDNLVFVAISSRKFSPDERLDVIVQEQMGVALFDEGMIDSILDVRDRCLTPGGKILPAKFEFYLEPVQLVARDRVPMIQEQQIQGIAFSPPPALVDHSYRFREVRHEQIDFLLGEPKPVFAFDLATLTAGQLPARFRTDKPVTRPGQLDGICCYFKAIFDEDIWFSTGPGADRTHWPMLLYRTPARSYGPGERFTMHVEVPDLSDYLGWSWWIGG